MGRRRQIKINGVMRDFDELRTLKSAELTSAGLTGNNDILEQRWRYKKNGDVEFFTGDPGADDIVFGGSKSDLRRIEELERNISVLATKVVTASSTSEYDSDDDNYDNVFDAGTRFKNEVRFSDAQVTFDGTSNLTIDTNTFHVDTTNNRVGIGTTSPDSTLHVEGDIRIKGTNYLRLNTNGSLRWTNSGDDQGVILSNGSSEHVFIRTNTAGDIIFKVAGTERMRIDDTTGKVSINSAFSFPTADGTADQVLVTDGSGTLSWADQSGSAGGTYTAQSTAPSSPSAGDEWYDTDTGDFYKYINDGTTSQWVEWSPGQGGATLDGTTEITGTITPSTDNTYALGSSSKKFSAVYSTSFEGTATSAQYADLAEMYAGDQAYEPGTVVVVGGTHEVTQCTKHLDSSLAGVVSEKPGYLMNKDIDAEYPVCVGFVGRVPVKVIGHIEKGDLLTTSSIPGFATKYSKGSYEPGCIIGVALTNKNEIGEGTVEVLLKRS